MNRYVQTMPELPDVYAADPVLRSWLDRLLGADGHAAARGRLTALSAEIGDSLRAAHTDAETHPPVLHRYGPFGARIDRIETAPGWQALRAAAARHAVVALPYQPQARSVWGAGARVVQYALLYLYGPESATFNCPLAMADGASALLSRPEVDPALRESWLPRLTATDPDVAITSGQWMTEAQGGSDVSGSTTVARRDGDGWRLTGEKWFCSAADSAMAIALATPEGGTGLSPFLVPRYAADSPLGAGLAADAPAPGVRVHRLKDKLGTRALPTAEIGLTSAYALPVGEPDEHGVARMMTLLRIARLHNAAASAAGMRRGLWLARAYAGERRVFGAPLAEAPLHRATLGRLAVHAEAAHALAAHGFALLGRIEVDGDTDAAAELRLAATLAKLATGKLAVSSASEYVECFGGAGYVEDTGIPRLIRDAQVLPIWEGATNVLALDLPRAIAGRGAHRPLLARIAAAASDAGKAGGRWLDPAGTALAEAHARLSAATDAVATDPTARRVVVGARTLALQLADAYAAALLVEQALYEADRGDQRAAAVAALWCADRLSGADVSADADTYFDALVDGAPLS
ncbi:acyl-CoA dehydrogenase family protein [Actinocatenispora sera]|uniref:acyl-CoA dehydrogenase family protein n=1 Tax=Actinocatenispora sera TaxID=390989 RepID=UPI0033F5CB3D